MRILYDSKRLQFKTPFGTLTPGERCTMHLYIPASCETTAAAVVLERETAHLCTVPMKRVRQVGPYEVYRAVVSIDECGLYFYYFDITTKTTHFPLYKQGNDTNMCAGDRWQVSCVPSDTCVPLQARGAVMYQIFPDRFYRSGVCDLREKLRPFSVHADWNELPDYLPAADGTVTNSDFFGGNLRGIREKLPTLRELGVEYVYLNPIVKAYSNHRYDACDYRAVDPMLGTAEDFTALCLAAHGLGMRVILDGVFSHTGSDSVYFDQYGRFGGGALAGKGSKYYSWYEFQHFPDRYTCWWGIPTLPCVRKLEPSFMDEIIWREDSVIAHWLALGADGFRLDVVDELPEPFLRALRQRLRELKPDALLIGEVWEDASNKIAYGVRRTYFTGGELDSVMNYPWRKAILRYCAGQDDGTALRESIETVAENYPPQILLCVMNSISTHDTARALTELADPFEGSRAARAARRLSPDARRLGLRRLRMAMALQFVLPGMPCIYYGDEAGLEGYADPFNRRCYPWGREDFDLRRFVAGLGQLRQHSAPLRLGTVRVTHARGGRVTICRDDGSHRVCLSCNMSATPWSIGTAQLLLGGLLEQLSGQSVVLSPGGFAIWTDE